MELITKIIEKVRGGSPTDEILQTICEGIGSAQYLQALRDIDFERVELQPYETEWIMNELKKGEQK